MFFVLIVVLFSSLSAAIEDNLNAEQKQFSTLEINQWLFNEFRCPHCYCGQTTHSEEYRSRIVGGRPTRPRQYPWMVALVTRQSNRLFCGATIISDHYVLTAAHCLKGWKWHDIEIVLSDGVFVDMMPGRAERRGVWELVIHEDFHRPAKYQNDIALLKMDRPVRLGLERQPACLPQPYYNYAGEMGRVVGWGLTSENGTRASWLREASVPILSSSTCKSLSGYMNLAKGMMCAAPLSGGVDACQGDSGGPLLVKDVTGRIAVAGIVSWGIGCARPFKPGIYTRVNLYLEWIAKNTKDSCYCY